ncbi:hypothetical protein HDV02_004680 [Globomyces sp. JEL0801]|nr:hypothetical protein HDV02_004680 [Globomyces sp. JEL0801]
MTEQQNYCTFVRDIPALKATAVPAFWVASQYTSNYSNTTCGVVTIILEIAWIFNDQLPSLSTAHRLTGLVLKRKLELMVMLFTGCSVLTGVILRVYRHSCRSGHCIGNESAVSEEHVIPELVHI